MTIEHPIGVDPVEWEHHKIYKLNIGVMWSWNLHTWTRIKDGHSEWMCTISPRRPFNFQHGYEMEYDAINAWMHVGEE
jgi:hypothetical protein